MADLGTRDNKNLLRGSMAVRVGVIRDGTQGISLSMGGKVIGEWTDSRARILSMTDDFRVEICGEDGARMYLFSVPGNTLSGEQLSETEVRVTFEMK